MKIKILLNNFYSVIRLAYKFSIFFKRNNFIFFLSGPLGVGKSFFCKNLIKFMGFKGLINSSSYILLNEYKINNNNLIYHFDFYRIKNIKDIIEIELFYYLNKKNICLIEWPDSIIDYLPNPDLHFIFSYFKNKKRYLNIITYSKLGKEKLKLIFKL